MASYAWGGHSNGQIPDTAMRLALGVYLRADAAVALIGMSVAFFLKFGVTLRVTEGYRSLGAPGDYAAGRGNTQWFYWERKQANPSAPAAAYPGGSIHGWALAVDINLNGLTDEMIQWLHTEGRAYGFNWDTTGKPSNEPWHLDFNLTVTASLGTTPLDNLINVIKQIVGKKMIYLKDLDNGEFRAIPEGAPDSYHFESMEEYGKFVDLVAFYNGQMPEQYRIVQAPPTEPAGVNHEQMMLFRSVYAGKKL